MSLISSHVDKCSSNQFFSNRCTILLYALLTKFELTTLLVKDNQFTSKSLFSSVQFSHSIVSDSLQLHGLQHDRLPCPSPTPKLTQTMSIESVIPSNHLIFLSSLLLLSSIFPSIRVFSNELALHTRWPKYWSFSFSICLPNEYSGLISFRIDWVDLHTVQGTFKSLPQHHSSKASIVLCSTLFIVQVSHT